MFDIKTVALIGVFAAPAYAQVPVTSAQQPADVNRERHQSFTSRSSAARLLRSTIVRAVATRRWILRARR
jgi:hypothetical protein